MRDCKVQGHIRVDQDPECLVCEMPIVPGDLISHEITRSHDELSPDSTASEQEWGKGATGV